MANRRSTVFDNVDPRLSRAVEAASRLYKPYRAEAFSGRSARPKNPSSYHPKGGALDVNLFDPKTGAQLANIQDPSTATAYQGFANQVYQWAQQNDPELAAQLRWGGYFKGGQWNRDWMHFDTGQQEVPMGGGSWSEGFDPDYVKQAKLAGGGGLGAQAAQMDAQMEAAGYTPEQRRAAIASIESAGSGDYNALGAWTGDPVEGRDRAYGKYQIMGNNIGPWAQQYLQQAGVTPDQFLKDPGLQDKMFDAVFGDYASKYGERGAASKWFTGSEKEPNRTDVNGKLTGGTYADKYMAALGATPHAQHPPNPQTGTGGFVAPGAPTTGVPGAKPTFMSRLAKGIGEMGAGGYGGGGESPYQMQPQIAAARIDQGETPTIDPQAQEMQRQQLALAMQRLNSGKLF